MFFAQLIACELLRIRFNLPSMLVKPVDIVTVKGKTKGQGKNWESEAPQPIWEFFGAHNQNNATRGGPGGRGPYNLSRNDFARRARKLPEKGLPIPPFRNKVCNARTRFLRDHPYAFRDRDDGLIHEAPMDTALSQSCGKSHVVFLVSNLRLDDLYGGFSVTKQTQKQKQKLSASAVQFCPGIVITDEFRSYKGSSAQNGTIAPTSLWSQTVNATHVSSHTSSQVRYSVSHKPLRPARASETRLDLNHVDSRRAELAKGHRKTGPQESRHAANKKSAGRGGFGGGQKAGCYLHRLMLDRGTEKSAGLPRHGWNTV
ncbi:hypothetical protein DL769_011461 [Monosporascus sp. CRB-8-3]|nr:hypothetical protein DL769_011461 [Monosporascus sp. CRB-8-3]